MLLMVRLLSNDAVDGALFLMCSSWVWALLSNSCTEFAPHHQVHMKHAIGMSGCPRLLSAVTITWRHRRTGRLHGSGPAQAALLRSRRRRAALRPRRR